MGILLDCHSHSSYSFDAHDSLEAMCEQAIKLGLQAYAVTDHCECNGYYDAQHYGKQPNEFEVFGCAKTTQMSIEHTTRLKEKLDGKLNLICGVELGQATFDLEAAENVVCDKRLDYVIASMHQLPNTLDFYFLKYEDPSKVPAMMYAYYEEILKLCQWGKFDTLAHLTYPLRYIEGEHAIKADLRNCRELTTEILRTLAQKGKSLEINTSGYRQKYGKAFPEAEHLKMFREFGGEFISLGADSHRTSDIAAGILDGIEFAKNAGFKYAVYYREHEPKAIKL
ncbi:MAG: histidinol-phosphatase HisJ family protein [Oscillospiraceae bacterium]|nr:histidinol-phosphatase HisJ family protein [Oscillospiraceae bacterium]